MRSTPMTAKPRSQETHEQWFASELLSPGSACPAYQIRLEQLRIANRIDTLEQEQIP